jgi:hypothetical protein
MCRNRILQVLGLVLLCGAPSLWAQCAAVTSDGTAVANQVSKFTTPCNIEPSAVTEVGGKVGIGTTTPAATLDVKGTATIRGTVQLPSIGTATAVKGFNSQPLDALASAFNSGTSRAVTQHFRWQAEPFFNDTSAPIGTMNLLYASGTAAPAETGFLVTNSGEAVATDFSVAPIGSTTSVFLADLSGEVIATNSIFLCVGSTKNCASGTVFHADSSGNLNITGTLSKGAGSFKIDHPLAPANKYLYHSFVESPDMMNVYNGNIVTSKNCTATVVLPDYFEALNRDFRYQLTVIGQFAQAIVAHEVKDNRFTIKTDKPGVKVSWQVTGIRHDAYADAHRIQVEENKPPQEQGHYLHPELFGQPNSKRDYAHRLPARDKQPESAKVGPAGD